MEMKLSWALKTSLSMSQGREESPCQALPEFLTLQIMQHNAVVIILKH